MPTTLFRVLRITSYVSLAAMVAALGWAGWHSVYYWNGIGV